MADLKLKDLRYLVAVADTRHFGQAAARCFVSQPTLSAQLKKLEDYLGVQLVERHPRRIALTEVGAQVVARARRIIEASDEIVALSALQRDPLSGRLRVALLPTIGPYLLPLVAARIRKKLPRIELLLYEYQTGPMLDHLQAGDIDMGILALPVPAEGLAERKLFDEPFVVAVPENHALGARKSLKTSDLDGETLLLLEDGHCLRDQALDVCSHSNVQEKQDFRATSLETLRQMVASGGGITLLPQLASTGAYGHARGVSIVPFTRPAPVRHIGALWRKTSAKQEAIAAVCDVIADAAGKTVTA
ncbi:MAG TPA: LysR substrate-binding domain-containing protein [Steroidobacteraceae bacterium]|nr:LysR substrate-binding domain-containing protein [Steroidobacteraceae bacterium]